MPQYDCGEADVRLLEQIRRFLTEQGEASGDFLKSAFAASSFPKYIDRLVIVVYQAGRKRLLVARRDPEAGVALISVLRAIRSHARYGDFDWDEPHCRLQIDFIIAPPGAVDIMRVGTTLWGDDHFEPGIDGLRFTHGKRSQYFLPGDAYVRSIMGMTQLRQWVMRALQVETLEGVRFQRFTSESYISGEAGWARLYRGHPLVGPVSDEKLRQAADLSLAHIKAQQQADGRFLYYYDAARDSRRDHEHPKRNPLTNPYYNILRHGGGILTCLYYARLYDDQSVMPTVRRAIDFLLEQGRTYTGSNGVPAGYIYYNRKAKLGGSGIALYALSEYQRLTGSNEYRGWADQLARHLLDQITESGEFIYYHTYLDKLITQEENKNYFSFYYPGEALCGLASYYKHVCDSRDLGVEIHKKVSRALRFLIVDRPGLRAQHYTSLPSDAWLMMAINELWDEPEFQVDMYKDFVFQDADAMVMRMYKVNDAPYPDYAGAFYYHYGDHPYPDGARCEGLQGALELAGKVGDSGRTATYRNALRLAAWAVLHLVNTPESVYFAANPGTAIGGVRFKYTRQWFRIDTIQHVVSFYLKHMSHAQQTGEM